MPFTPIRVECGGGAFTDGTTGKTWAADSNFSGGSTSTDSNTIKCFHPSESPIYQSARWGNSTYTFSVTSGNYKVVLKLAESHYSGVNQRIFSVVLNGTTVISNLDMTLVFGVFTARDYCYLLNGVSTITIQMVNGAVDNAQINAIEIVDGTTAGVWGGLVPLAPTILAGQTQQFMVIGDYVPIGTGVNWSISPNVGSISATGLYTAPSSLTTNQTITVTAVDAGNPSNTATTTILLWAWSTSTGKILRMLSSQAAASPIALRPSPILRPM